MAANLNDAIGVANLLDGVNNAFTFDRFCSPQSAVYLNRGYVQAPPGRYFFGDFSLIAWVQLISYEYNTRFIDFESDSTNRVVFGTDISTGALMAQINSNQMVSTTVIGLNRWYHLAFVLSGTTGFLYVNGVQVSVGTLASVTNQSMTSNFIGKSNTPTDSNANGIYDELKMFSGALSPSDIFNDYNANKGKWFF